MFAFNSQNLNSSTGNTADANHTHTLKQNDLTNNLFLGSPLPFLSLSPAPPHHTHTHTDRHIDGHKGIIIACLTVISSTQHKDSSYFLQNL